MKPDQPLAVVLLVSALPVLAMVAFLICRTSRGPVVVMEEPRSNDTDAVRCFRFHTRGEMAKKHRELSAFLKAWSVDRLPGLWNVFGGDIGIRPFLELVRRPIASC